MNKPKRTNTEAITSFVKDVELLFQFLRNDFFYTIKSKEIIEGNFAEIIYVKNEIAVGISYHIKDERINTWISKIIDGKPADYWDRENTLLLINLILYYEHNFYIQKLDFEHFDYLESLILHANYLEKYGKNILNGMEWLSNNMVNDKLDKLRKSLRTINKS